MNAKDGRDWLVDTEMGLQEVVEILSETRAIMVQALDAAEGEEARKTLGTRVEQLLRHLVQLSNRSTQGRYTFGGRETLSTPYTASYEVEDETFTAAHDQPVSLGNTGLNVGSVVVTTLDGATTYVEDVDYTVDYGQGTITVLSTGGMTDGADHLIDYQTRSIASVQANPDGVDGDIQRAIGEGMTMVVNVPGSEVFTGDVDVFESLIQLRNQLERNDVGGIRQSADVLDTCLDQVATTLTVVGSKIEQQESTVRMLEHEETSFARLLSAEEDADIAELVVKLQTDQLAYESALQAGAMILQQSLLDFLG
jgi:flagellar hook-associated protein 3 FlgL